MLSSATFAIAVVLMVDNRALLNVDSGFSMRVRFNLSISFRNVVLNRFFREPSEVGPHLQPGARTFYGTKFHC
jgi:hypothetical protein